MKDRFGIDWSKSNGRPFWKGPHLERRVFFRQLATGLAGYYLMPSRPAERIAYAAATPKATAKNCIFILMNGAPSHIDTFDLKEGPWLPAALNPTSFGDIRFPQGLFPKLSDQLDRIALLRSIKPWATAHGLAQTWLQIGRNPVSGLSKIAPHIGSVAALELGPTTADRSLPAFISLNTGVGPGPGYLAPENAPFYVSPNGGGLSNTTHFDGPAAFDRRSALLLDLDATARAEGSLGSNAIEMAKWSDDARRLTYNPAVAKIFTLDSAERLRYGNSTFANACLVARNLISANLGTRFVQISIGSWDMHSNIYSGGLNPANANSLARVFDAGLGALLDDMKKSGQLDSTLIVAMGEFGRTLGALNTTAGRDHYIHQAALFAGGGVQGGRAIGATDERGSVTVEPGWSQDRDVRPEDIEATIYSALGIDWTTVRHDDPLNRGFSYVPQNDGIIYAPVDELWG